MRRQGITFSAAAAWQKAIERDLAQATAAVCVNDWIATPNGRPLEAFATTLLNEYVTLEDLAELFASYGITLDIERVRKLLVFS